MLGWADVPQGPPARQLRSRILGWVKSSTAIWDTLARQVCNKIVDSVHVTAPHAERSVQVDSGCLQLSSATLFASFGADLRKLGCFVHHRTSRTTSLQRSIAISHLAVVAPHTMLKKDVQSFFTACPRCIWSSKCYARAGVIFHAISALLLFARA